MATGQANAEILRQVPNAELCSGTANLLWGGIMTLCFLERAGCAGGQGNTLLRG